MRRTAPLLTAAVVAGLACADRAPDAASDGAAADGVPAAARALGPVDGHDLPGADLDRVAVGDPAPDFTLASWAHGPVTLSDYRGRKEVLLVFYRGHW